MIRTLVTLVMTIIATTYLQAEDGASFVVAGAITCGLVVGASTWVTYGLIRWLNELPITPLQRMTISPLGSMQQAIHYALLAGIAGCLVLALILKCAGVPVLEEPTLP